LKRLIPGITERMLTLKLKELEKDGLLKKTVYAEVPVRVNYQLTEIAIELIPIWDCLRKWGKKHKEMPNLILLEKTASPILLSIIDGNVRMEG
jgi:DNA-binding HxlR family transcriptional regulator